MLAQGIEAHILEHLQFIRDRLLRGIGEQTVRPIALIQHAVKEIGLAVKRQPCDALCVLGNSKGADSEIRLQSVTRFVCDHKIIKLGMFGRPECKIIAKLHLLGVLCAQDLSPIVQHRKSLLLAKAVGFDANAFIGGVWRDPQISDMLLGHSLQPNRLPDPALGCIPDPAAPIALLPACSAVARCLIGTLHADLICTGLQGMADVKRKRRKSAAVTSHENFIAVHAALTVHRTEAQQCNALQKRGINRYRAAVDQTLTRAKRKALLDTAVQRFGRKRHKNFSIVQNRSVQRQLLQRPPAIQTKPALALRLRQGMLGMGNLPHRICGL